MVDEVGWPALAETRDALPTMAAANCWPVRAPLVSGLSALNLTHLG
jgi:hypothetical protein